MISLGIESTAHTFGVGLCDDEKILANVKSVYQPPLGSGIHPKEASMHHNKHAAKIVVAALKQAGIRLSDIEIVSVSQGPGMPPCLHVGMLTAKYIALKSGSPLVGVNHCVAHIEIGRMATGAKDPIVVYVSGGNTQVIGYAAGRYRVFGETLDIAIGNALDSFARSCGLPHPGGPEVMKLAEKSKNYIQLPYVVKGMDLSFSGIVTEAVKKFKTAKEREKILPDLCFSFQETTFAMLTEVTERALTHTGKQEVLLTGGVAASERFREMMDIMCKERDAKSHVVPQEYAGDNGAMIAWSGLVQYRSGEPPIKLTDTIKQKWRTDDVEIRWI